MSVKTTRMELLNTRKKLKLAQKGHKLLKQKRDVLIGEFFSVLKDIKKFRQRIIEKITVAQKSLYNAEAIEGELEIDRIALGLAEGVKYDIGFKSIMGVKIPQITNISVDKQWYGHFDETLELDTAINNYRHLFPDFIKLAEKQLTLKHLSEEIKKTKRRVNSLEYLTIPKLEHLKKLITFKFEELERENFSRLKIIKKLTARE